MNIFNECFFVMLENNESSIGSIKIKELNKVYKATGPCHSLFIPLWNCVFHLFEFEIYVDKKDHLAFFK